MDTISGIRRSWIMSRIRSKNTVPEKQVRSMLHKAGVRFRIHRKDLPGNPDIVLPKRKKVIFVHGCFWHRHRGCRFAYTPKSRIDFWEKKFERNVQRHEKVEKMLKELGWDVIVIWECEIPSLTAQRLMEIIS